MTRAVAGKEKAPWLCSANAPRFLPLFLATTPLSGWPASTVRLSDLLTRTRKSERGQIAY